MIRTRFKKIYTYRHALWDMALSQLKTKYAGSYLGIWWVVATPLILALSINFVFTAVFKVNIPGYTFFVLSAILPWIFFNNALIDATNSFVSNSAILKQVLFPREIIPISSVLANLLNFLIGLGFLMPVFIILNIKMIMFLPILIIVILLHFIFILGLAFLFSCANVFLRDINHFLMSVFMIWFWVTPVFFSLDMLSFPLRWICLLNPVTYYVISYRKVLFEAALPDLSNLTISFVLSLFFLIIGYTFFVRKEPLLLKKI